MVHVEISVTGDTEVAGYFGALPEELRLAIAKKVADFTGQLWDKIVNQNLNGVILQRRSGKLADSIKSKVDDKGDVITGTVFSDGSAPYAAIQEYGGKTSPHDIVPDKAKALHFLMGGKDTFATIVHHPGSTIPAHAFMRSALADMVPVIEEGFREAVARAVADRPVPTE
jgi:phage gpG-like protein